MNRSLKNTLIVAGAGCALLLVLAAVSCVGFIVWLNRPGTLLEEGRLTGADTAGLVSWTLRLEDPGTRAFVESVLERTNHAHRRRTPFPPWIAGWLEGYRDRQNRHNLDQLFPLRVAWTLHPSPDEAADLQLYSVSLQGVGNRLALADWALGFAFFMSPEIEIVTHSNERIYQLPIRPGRFIPFFIRGNDLFFASDLDTARQAVDRLVASTSGPASSAQAPQGARVGFQDLYALTSAERPLRGALSNEHGEVVRLLRRLAGEGPWDDPDSFWGRVRGMTMDGGFEDARVFSGSLDLWGPDPAWAGLHARDIQEVVQILLDRSPFKAEATASADGEWVRIGYRIEDPASQLGGLLDGPRVSPEADMPPDTVPPSMPPESR